MTAKGRVLAKGKSGSEGGSGIADAPSRKDRAKTQAEKLTRRISPPKTKLPIIMRAKGAVDDPYLPLIASGIVLLPGTARPVFLLKHESSGETLPVWMHPIDASVGLNELGQGAVGSPHTVAKQILERLGVGEIECYFTERVGHHQYVQIELLRNGQSVLPGGPIRVRADEVMSFCIANKARFFSTKNFIAQCRVLNEELEKLQEGLLTGAAAQAFPELEIGSKKSGYMM